MSSDTIVPMQWLEVLDPRAEQTLWKGVGGNLHTDTEVVLVASCRDFVLALLASVSDLATTLDTDEISLRNYVARSLDQPFEVLRYTGPSVPGVRSHVRLSLPRSQSGSAIVLGQWDGDAAQLPRLSASFWRDLEAPYSTSLSGVDVSIQPLSETISGRTHNVWPCILAVGEGPRVGLASGNIYDTHHLPRIPRADEDETFEQARILGYMPLPESITQIGDHGFFEVRVVFEVAARIWQRHHHYEYPNIFVLSTLCPLGRENEKNPRTPQSSRGASARGLDHEYDYAPYERQQRRCYQ